MGGLLYFWENGQLVICEPDGLWPSNALCYDSRYAHAGNKEKFGMWSLHYYDWKAIPLEKFPKEFRTHLLLLGVQL